MVEDFYACFGHMSLISSPKNHRSELLDFRLMRIECVCVCCVCEQMSMCMYKRLKPTLKFNTKLLNSLVDYGAEIILKDFAV